MIDLPKFPYHRDPVASGAVRETDASCECCGERRGAAFAGVIYCIEPPAVLCPWCIADGSAANRYDATFFDAEFVDDDLKPIDLPIHVQRSVFDQTIGFSTFNPFGWWVHCSEPAEFVRRDEPYDMIFECRRCQLQHTIQDFD